MFNINERRSILPNVRIILNKANINISNVKDVHTPSVSKDGKFGTIAAVDTPLIIAITTDSNIATVTNTATKKISKVTVDSKLRKTVIKQMLDFSGVIRY